jgi:hypothetical protein
MQEIPYVSLSGIAPRWNCFEEMEDKGKVTARTMTGDMIFLSFVDEINVRYPILQTIYQFYTLTSSPDSDIAAEHARHVATLIISVEPKQDKLPTMYWLPKMHKTPYKARFMANSSSCTTTKVSVLLKSCLTAIKKLHSIRYCKKVLKPLAFWSL